MVQLVSPFVDTSSEKLAVQPEKANADGIFFRLWKSSGIDHPYVNDYSQKELQRVFRL